MHRLVHIAVGTLMLAGVAESATAATWRLAQSAGETITLTVTNTVIHIVTHDSRIEIPVAQVQSLHVTTAISTRLRSGNRGSRKAMIAAGPARHWMPSWITVAKE
jgi:uncharacterized lipoprotein YajG